MSQYSNTYTYPLGEKPLGPTPRIDLVQERSFNGAPIVGVTFPDGYKDHLELSIFYGNQVDRISGIERCHYIGHLANEPEACVAMTGCVGSEDVEFTIFSTHVNESPMFKWTKNGNVEIIEKSFEVIILSVAKSFFYLSLPIFFTENIEWFAWEKRKPSNSS